MKNLTILSGLSALNQKRYQDVHSHSIVMIKENIDNPIPYFLLAVLAYDHKNYIKAEDLFLRAETLNPLEPHYPAFLGRLYAELKRSEDATHAANRASNRTINHGYLADILGVIYSRVSYHEKAVELFKTAVKLDNKQSNFFYNLGASELFLGNFDKAKNAFSEAIKLNGNHYGAWASLVTLDKQTEANNNIEHLQNLYHRLKDNEDAKHQLGHAIAKSLEDLDQHEDSIRWLKNAKTEKRKSVKATATIKFREKPRLTRHGKRLQQKLMDITAKQYPFLLLVSLARVPRLSTAFYPLTLKLVQQENLTSSQISLKQLRKPLLISF